MFQKFLTPFFILIFIFCFAGYVMFVTKKSPTQEPVKTPVTTAAYTNTEYGFSIALPASWKGYSIVNDTWKAYSLDKPQGEKPDESGPLISIRHPKWTSAVPRQDIPIMVFTLAQWNLITQDKIHIGAAPINPSELARNAKYVFALPARYNFAFPVGYEEVDTILQTKPLRGI